MAVLAAALDYQHRGWATLPVRGKEPAGDLIRHTRGTAAWGSLRDRPAERDEIRRWLELDPQAGVAVILGEPSRGLVVVDVDRPELAPELPETATVRTGRGSHRYFASSAPPPSRAYPWGELRSDGSYVVAPPSLHPGGSRYAWQRPLELGLRELPGGLARLISTTCSFSFTTVCAARETGAPRDALHPAVSACLGLPDAPLGTALLCPLHRDARPSGSLWRARDGRVLWHDWHYARHGSPEWLSLPALRAALAGRPLPLRPPEHVTWRLRLAVEAGLLERYPVRLWRPGGLSQDAGRVRDGLELLYACKWLVEPGAPTAFALEFAAAWCGLERGRVRDGLAELARAGVVEPAGRHGLLRLWQPRAPPAETSPTKATDNTDERR